MDNDAVLSLLRSVRDGETAPEEAVLLLKKRPFEDLGYAKIDHHRQLRHGIPEVVYGGGKTAEQITGILGAMRESGYGSVLVTRLDSDKAEAVNAVVPITYYPVPRLGLLGELPAAATDGVIAVAAAGTSDLPVAEEAAITAQSLGNRVERLYDVGVAGLHRLLSKLDVLMDARVVVAVAGMEGALATVIGGLVACPVIAVPASVGYGANFGGLSALLSMLNSCAGNVSVVNIDNGFGAGYLAGIINRIGERRQ
ncbi:MAG: nickel pincer cofactor biosynthesis protein LarB [Oscillospiraceae bacterium]|jgi:NCAIR mutase (PurE)-related protein|nr:nickel pincer cofactor biosynthesis protein LarB [Oscillospiraceae bacterium]